MSYMGKYLQLVVTNVTRAAAAPAWSFFIIRDQYFREKNGLSQVDCRRNVILISFLQKHSGKSCDGTYTKCLPNAFAQCVS